MGQFLTTRIHSIALPIGGATEMFFPKGLVLILAVLHMVDMKECVVSESNNTLAQLVRR